MASQVSWKKPLLLSITLFALGSLAYWLEYTHRPQTEAKEELSKKFFELKDLSIEKVTLDNGAKAFHFTCLDIDQKKCKPSDQSRWNVQLDGASGAPKDKAIRADDSNVNSFLSSLSNLTANEVFNLKEDTEEKRSQLLKEYGLAKETLNTAKTQKVMITSQGKIWTAFLGATHPIGDGLFALAQTESAPDFNRVLLIPVYFKTNFEKDLTHWRNKKVLDFSAGDVEAFKLESPKGRLSAKKKDNEWNLLLSGEKAELPGDFENTDNFLSNLSYISAKEFISENLKESAAVKIMAGTKKLIQAEFSLKGQKEPLQISVFEKPGKPSRFFASLSPTSPLMEIESSSKDRFVKDPVDFRLMKLMTLTDRFAFKRIELSQNSWSKAAVLKQEGSTWKMEGESGKVNQDKVQQILEKFSGNRIKKFVPNSEPSPKEAFSVSFGDEKEPKKREFLVWKKGSDLLIKDLHSKRAEIYNADPSIAMSLPFDPNPKTPTFYLETPASPTPAK